MDKGKLPLLKVCGLQDADTLKAIFPLAVDIVGFVFADSRRKVTPKRVEAIARQAGEWAGDRPLKAGVFVDSERSELLRAIDRAGLDIVQLHGRETPEDCRQIKRARKVRIFKVFSVSAASAGRMEQPASPPERLAPYFPHIDAVMLDTFDPVQGGGTGKTFAWDRIPEYRAAARAADLPLIVAGGLNADNVARLLADFHPDGVDVSSGVETDGVKDIEKIKRFVERVKSS